MYHFPERDKHNEADKGSGYDDRSDSVWAVVASAAKAYGLPFDYVLYEVSYANLTLYSAVLPSYHSPKDKEGKKGKRRDDVRVKADDPKNKAKVMELLKKMK